MNNVEKNNIEKFCEKYACKKTGSIRPSHKYPFIFLINFRKSIYINRLDVKNDGNNSVVHFCASKYKGKHNMNYTYNQAIINHKNLNGVYHSIFLFDKVGSNLYFLGEYELHEVAYDRNEIIDCFVLKKINNETLDNVRIYYVEDTEPVACISELGSRNDFIDGLYEDNIHNIELDKNSFEKGDFLDSNYRSIDLSRIIDTEQLRVDQGIMRLNFRMSQDATPSERRLGQHLFMLSELNADIQLLSMNGGGGLEEPIGLEGNGETGDSEIANKNDVDEAYLYTVNVGCGLTNFLVLKKNNQATVWAIDWGSSINFSSNAIQFIYDCIEDIKDTFFGGNKFTISKLFISHPDYDHYNRIDTTMLDSNTEVWVSGHIFKAGQYGNLINKIKSITTCFKTPVCSNSTQMINILHPYQPIVYGTKTFAGTGFYLAKKTNDVSYILSIIINGTKTMFTGDIMQTGWGWYMAHSTIKGIDTDIYMHSHHGSKNGFITNIPNTNDCEYDTVKFDIDILSTRDKTYNDIPSSDMIKHPQYANTYSTQIGGAELKYYKTDILSKIVTAVCVI